jgi:glycerol-3-phosphate cytidylyltransferase
MIIYTGGTFDLFHSGHVRLLERCKAISGGGKVIVALNTDEFILEYKGKAPIISFDDRAEVLLSCKYVDRVIPNYGGTDSRQSILSVMPDIIVIGSDWAKKDYYKQMGFTQEWLDEYGIGLAYIPYTKGISSTDIKGRL